MSALHFLADGVSPDNRQGREWARDELSSSEYHRSTGPNWAQRTLTSIYQWFTDNSGVLSVIFWLLVAAGVALLIVYLARYVRRTPRVATADAATTGAVLGGQAATAREFRAQARAALGAGDFDGCVIAATRALAQRGFERNLLEDVPSLTAHEVSTLLARYFGPLAADLHRCTDLFDAIAYGDRHADAGAARFALDLEETISATKPSESPTATVGFAVPR